MATTTLHLLRHAEPEPTGKDPGLSDAGQEQAASVAVALRSLGASEILHSPSRRAVETAAIVAASLRIPPKQSSLATDLTPIPIDWSTVPQKYHQFLRSVPRAEQDIEGAKLNAAFDKLGTVGSADRTIVMVTHNFVIGWFIRRALDAPWWRWIGINQHHASVSTIQWANDTEPRLLRSNVRGLL